MAGYIPALAEANPSPFGVAVAAWSRETVQTETGSFIQNGFSRFGGRPLQLDEPVYASELATNRRNLGIANLLEEQGCICFEPEASSELYTRQCALKVSCHDLAVMAATGLDETSGDWIVAIGLPGKSGVSGGLISATPAREAWPPTPPRSMPLATACAANSPPRFCPSAWGCICWYRSRSLPLRNDAINAPRATRI